MTVYDILFPVTVLGTMSVGVYVFTKTLTDYFLRRKMVEKGYVDKESKYLLENETDISKYDSLKWGIIVLAAGIGMVIIEYLPRKHDSLLPFGVFAICVSVGFLTYFVIAKKLTKKE